MASCNWSFDAQRQRRDTVTVRELLGGMPELHQKVFQPMEPLWMVSSKRMETKPEVNVMVYETNTIQKGNGFIDQVMRGEVLYAVGILRLAVYMGKDPNPYMMMLDNRAEINVMHSSLAAKLGLVVIQLNYRLMMSTNQSKSKFLGIMEDTPVSIGSF